jgi:hypothetical protein
VCEGLDRFTRADLKIIFESTVGKVPNTPAKFTKYLKHHGLDVGPNRIRGKTERGSLVIEWRDSADWFTKTQRDYGVMKTVPEETDDEAGRQHGP